MKDDMTPIDRAIEVPSETSSPSRSTGSARSVNKEAAHRLKANNVNFHYGKKQILFNINMNIPEKQVTAFIGPSGCGKTTFLRMMNRMCDMADTARHEGEIVIDGLNILEKTANVVALRRKIGMVFQKPNPFPKSI